MTTSAASEIFENWRASRLRDVHDPLTIAGTRSYKAIWNKWVWWLTEDKGINGTSSLRASSYLDATPSQISTFLLNGPSPISGRRSKTSPLSEITRRRYWSVLSRVYEHAKSQGLIAINPAALLDNEKPPQENPTGQIFHANQWAAIETGLPGGNTEMQIRDRALLLLMMDAALTVAELCALQQTHVAPCMLEPDLFRLRIDGKRKAQFREITLNARTTKALQKWVDLRINISPKPTVKNDPMFLTERRVGVSPRVVFHLVATSVTKAFKAAGLDLPMHLGPQVLRNSRIVFWLNSGMTASEVVHRAGLKDSKSFRGLREHIPAPGSKAPALA